MAPVGRLRGHAGGPGRSMLPVARGALVSGALVWAVVVGRLAQASYDVAGAVVLASILVVVTVPALAWLGRRDGTPGVVPLLVGGYLAKLAASAARYLVAFDVYDGAADAAQYHQVGGEVASQLWSGSLAVELGKIPGTGFIELLTGITYASVGPSLGAGFVAFATLAYAGQVLFWKAFRVGIPDGSSLRYAALVLLLPSMLFWPSSIGKEAWMMFCLGLCALGVARRLSGASQGLLLLGGGLLGAYLVRPHVAMLVVTAYVATSVLRPGARRSPPLVRMVGVLALLLVAALLLVRVQSYFGVETSGVDLGAGQVFDKTVEQTAAGGSSFQPVVASNPLLVPFAAASVLYRPLPFEASNAQMVVASIEGLVLVALTLAYRRNVVAAVRTSRRRRYVLYALVYSLLFVVAFSNIGNFGILVRQRTQVLPFVLVAVCVPVSTGLIGDRSPSQLGPRRSRVVGVQDPVRSGVRRSGGHDASDGVRREDRAARLAVARRPGVAGVGGAPPGPRAGAAWPDGVVGGPPDATL